VEQKLAAALRFVIPGVGVFIFLDVGGDEPDFPLLDAAVGFFDDFVIVAGLAIVGDELFVGVIALGRLAGGLLSRGSGPSNAEN
jgi:hypothetical protein